ncbi:MULTISPECIES: PLP-dependent aminotransferase family protein [unclassified Gordonia (in: high G+C Gram-positive bacteria)]|uniref:aminotransferase-like domain-containing protein n=1 Tax=unclassified Gordonia (in: high G+C Gram-positive bacteria) TaxID=2657482 RepID=UPI0021A94169|nr:MULTISPECIES: PLP-dependent aminotransferase family protein [unclassified Gordonia (in: high G+C Gram-positive bacteria)]MCT1353762.1 PLP-dependent aminotransferase family protein [Gordonia sp. p3-SID1431]WGJ84972.1 PLP-dependent aminotransferase family protein [Gordonia sp. SMJS1]
MTTTETAYHNRHSAPTLPLAGRAKDLVGSMIDSSTSLLAAQSHDIVRFAMGSPADEAVPADEFRQIAGEILDHTSFTYGATEGEPRLLQLLVDYLATTPDPSSLDRLVITTGGMQGLDLACKLFVDPGDLVIVESPTYTNGSATALSYGAQLLEVPVDDDGMQVDQLEALVARTRQTPKAIYTIPTFQNPSGVTMSEERRRELLRLAHTWGSVIIDDDPYGLLRFAGTDIPTFQTLSPGDPLIFSVRTFSKILAPGWRVGWVDADPSLRQLLINGKQAMDTCTNVPNQHIVAEYIARGGLEDHLAGIRLLYRERKEAMLDAIRRHLGDRVVTTDPEGGFFLWVTLRDEFAEIDTRELFEVALADGVAFIPGPALSPGKRFRNSMRLCFASSTPERIDEGVRRLTASLEKMAG